MMLLLHIFALAYLCSLGRTAQNITVDDTDPSITYQGDWEDTPIDPLNFGGTHKVTLNSDATASFTFTGTAIYFLSPLWPFRVTTSISLDGQPPALVDLQDHDVPYNDDGPETAASNVVWFVDGLENTGHLLLISVGNGEDLAVLDGLIYTVPDPNDPTTTSTPGPSSSTTRTSRILPPPTSTSNQSSTTSNSSSKQGLSIAIGIVCTIFGLLVIYGIYWYWRRRRRLAEEEAYVAAGDNPDAEMANASNTRPSYPRTWLLGATGAAGSANGTRNKRRRPPPPPPRPGARHSAAAAAALRTKNPLTTIPETRDDSADGRPTSSIAYQQDGRNDSTSMTSPSPSLFRNENGSLDRTVKLVKAGKEEQDPWTYPRP